MQAKRESSSPPTRHHAVCVVGAGPCGLTAIRNLEKHGIESLVCHEGYDAVGGLWAYSEDPERPSVYDSAHIRACSHHVNSQPTALKKFRHSCGLNIWQTSPIAFQTSSKVLAPALLR